MRGTRGLGNGLAALNGGMRSCVCGIPRGRRAADGRGYPMFIMTQSDRGGRKNTAEEEAAIIDYVTKPLLNMLRQYHAKMEDLYQARQTKTLKVGDYHPALSNLLYYIGIYCQCSLAA